MERHKILETDVCLLNVKSNQTSKVNQVVHCDFLYCLFSSDCVYQNISWDSFSLIIWKTVCHIIIMHKFKHILYRYFPENLRLWREVILYVGLLSHTRVHSVYSMTGLCRALNLGSSYNRNVTMLNYLWFTHQLCLCIIGC